MKQCITRSEYGVQYPHLYVGETVFGHDLLGGNRKVDRIHAADHADQHEKPQNYPPCPCRHTPPFGCGRIVRRAREICIDCYVLWRGHAHFSRVACAVRTSVVPFHCVHMAHATSASILNQCVTGSRNAFMLRLRSREACPELVETCPERSRRGLSTNGVSFPHFSLFILSVTTAGDEVEGHT